MSSLELGLAGVWSCLYCEGCWLSKAELARARTPDARLDRPTTLPAGSGNPDLVCPACATTSFVSFSIGGTPLHRCRSCGSVFLGKSALARLAPDAVRGRDLPSTLGWIMGGAVAGDIALTLAFWLFG